jgi:hypothetical protein
MEFSPFLFELRAALVDAAEISRLQMVWLLNHPDGGLSSQNSSLKGMRATAAGARGCEKITRSPISSIRRVFPRRPDGGRGGCEASYGFD